MISNDKNIVLNQIYADVSSWKFKELVPSYSFNGRDQALFKYPDGNVSWAPIDISINILEENKFIGTNIYYSDGRVGFGRSPLFSYKMDIAVPKDTLMTAFHIGDGSFGFSMGNGATEGFIPEIIGIGADENDAGLYLVGIASNDVPSDIPLLILDGRNSYNEKLINRPILGVTSSNYNKYSLLLDASENLNINGIISATDVILDNVSLIGIIKELQEQIEELKTKIR